MFPYSKLHLSNYHMRGLLLFLMKFSFYKTLKFQMNVVFYFLLFWHIFSRQAIAGNAFSYEYIYNAPESAQDNRYTYHWTILRTALEKTKSSHGEYQVKPSLPMTETRQVHELITNSGKINIIYMSISPELEKQAIPIRIPVDKNLVGYRVFMIRKGDESRFANINSIEDLRKFKFGFGLGWDDVEVLRVNNLDVVTGSNYEGLFEMLIHKRFDVFLRGANEVVDECESHNCLTKDVSIEKTLLLYYPMPMYFWFPKTPEGLKLALRVEAGMWSMINDGSYDQIFSNHFNDKVKDLNLSERKFLSITNPYVDNKKLNSDNRLWFKIKEKVE